MRLLVSGSLAYDRIMNFEGRFSDHILPDKIHVLNVSFNVNGLQEKLGGTAGNIAYGLAQLGESPSILACVGKDGQRYLDWLKQHGVDTCCIQTVEDEYTAGCYITTDLSDNQIAGFNPGAMNRPCGFDFSTCDPNGSLGIVAAGNPEDMAGFPGMFRERGIDFIYDPGQALNFLQGPQLLDSLTGARILISNDYELEIIMHKTGLNREALLDKVQTIITTKGEQGSVLLEKERQVGIPAAPAETVKDPTGAGDAYRSGIMKGMTLGLDLAQACLWGAALSSFAVACYGTQEYAVTETEFNQRLDQVKQMVSWA
ncbi:MAG: carbohydrate kinase family protein [Desulfarculaceae bacterium]